MRALKGKLSVRREAKQGIVQPFGASVLVISKLAGLMEEYSRLMDHGGLPGPGGEGRGQQGGQDCMSK